MKSMQQMQQEVRRVSSQCKDWEVRYFAEQATGLAELACSKELFVNAKQKELQKEAIYMARLMRKELLERFGLVLWGRWLVITKNCEVYTSPKRHDLEY